MYFDRQNCHAKEMEGTMKSMQGETKQLKYEDWSIHPEIARAVPAKRVAGDAIWQGMTTKHEGTLLYLKLWNFWVRAGVEADTRSTMFFRDYERANEDTDRLLRDVGFPWKKAETEEEIWGRVGMVWNWLKSNVQVNNAESATISSDPDEWPSILDYARYYVGHGHLVWAACFSKAHLFATLLGRVAYPRFRFAIAEAHHAEGGAPPTATHVYVAVYAAERWFYLDPTAVYSTVFPTYGERKSIGVDGFVTVDYEHPYKIIPVPLSGFERVPYLPQ